MKDSVLNLIGIPDYIRPIINDPLNKWIKTNQKKFIANIEEDYAPSSLLSIWIRHDSIGSTYIVFCIKEALVVIYRR